MPAHRIDMRLIKEVLRLKFAAHLSHRQIAAALRIGSGSVSNYLAAFERARLTYPLPAGIDEADLERLLFPPIQTIAPSSLVMPDFPDIHAQLRLKAVKIKIAEYGLNFYIETILRL